MEAVFPVGCGLEQEYVVHTLAVRVFLFKDPSEQPLTSWLLSPVPPCFTVTPKPFSV